MLFLTTLLLSLTQPAEACSGFSSLAWVSPTDGATDVATDARFLATMHWGGSPGLLQVDLIDATGTNHPVNFISDYDHSDDSVLGLGVIEIVPDTPLIGGMTYTLTVTDIQFGVPWSRTFTTSNGVTPSVGAPPVMNYIQIGPVQTFLDSCSWGDFRTIEVCVAPSQVGSADNLELMRVYRLENASSTSGVRVRTLQVPTDGSALSVPLFTEWGATPDECFVATLVSASGEESAWSNRICYGVDPELGQCSAVIPVDVDGDGFASDVDCDDQNGAIHPNAVETFYNGVDENCDGLSDFDADGDGHDSSQHGGLDCDDQDAGRSPDAVEVYYDGIDQNCDGANDFDQDMDGYESDEFEGADCDDKDATTHPGATEVWYDGLDQDCAGGDDFDQDGDGFRLGDQEAPDCDDANDTIFPGAEDTPYDRIDQDCDGVDSGPPECSSVSAAGLAIWLLPALFIRRRLTG